MSADPGKLMKRRADYAREVSARYGAPDPRVEAAFADIPREAFLGPPPWSIGSGGTASWSTTSEPASVYQDQLIVLRPEKGINNGQPSLHASCIAALELQGGELVLHVGAGTGYYTAILAQIAREVIAYELDPSLASQARRNLAAWPNVTVRAETATGRALPLADAVYVCAGATHPDPHWLDALTEKGRLLFPLTGDEGWGGMLLVKRAGSGFSARFVARCGFIACEGLRDPSTAVRLTEAFRAGGQDQVRFLGRGMPPKSAWFAGDGWYLAKDAPA